MFVEFKHIPAVDLLGHADKSNMVVAVNSALVTWAMPIAGGRTILHFAGEPVGATGMIVDHPIEFVAGKLRGEVA